MVEFCNSCGAIIMGKKGEDVTCPSCGKSKKAKEEVSLSQKVDKKENIEILNTKDTTQIHPTTQVECPQCKSTEAYYWTKQTRAADEPETQFFKCVKCSHQWRDYR